MTDFWDWAVAAYARDGVAGACLVLQDEHGQCVPLLLWAAWRAVHGQGITDGEAFEAARIAHVWTEEVVAPLRQVRRRLKASLDEGDDVVRLPLREKIKAVELEAERVFMSRLAGVGSEKSHLKQSFNVALLIAADAWSAPDVNDDLEDGLRRLAEALTKA